MDRKVDKAMNLLLSKFEVDPIAYTLYNDGFIFAAYPKGLKKEKRKNIMNTLYLVDLKTNSAGPFSVAFDIDGFRKASENFKIIE